MKKKKKNYIIQKQLLYQQKQKKNLIYVYALKKNFEIPYLKRINFFFEIRKNSEWNSFKTLICPYTFSSKVPTKNFMFSRFYYVKYTTFLSNSALRKI